MPWLLRVLAALYLLSAGYVACWVLQLLPAQAGAIDWVVATSSLTALVLGVGVWFFSRLRRAVAISTTIDLAL
jgi:hypothetical protein